MTPNEQIDAWLDASKPRLVPGTVQEMEAREARYGSHEDWWELRLKVEGYWDDYGRRHPPTPMVKLGRGSAH